FGPYSAGKFKTVRKVFGSMRDTYQNGIKGVFRRAMKYKCNNTICPKGNLAKHPNKYWVQICSNNFFTGDPNNNGWKRLRTYALLHEWLHGIGDGRTPHDVCDSQCYGGILCGSHTCYQYSSAGALMGSWSFPDHASGQDDNPRR